MPTGQIEPKTSDWDLIKSAPGICVVGKTSDGNFYEVAVRRSYAPWLESHKFQFELGLQYDPAKPAAQFLENVIREISQGRGPTFEQYFRRICPDQLQIPLERAILNHRVLVNSTLATPK